jgi:HemY protein
MIRVLVYLLIIGALAFGVVWLADRSSEVTIIWHGQPIDTLDTVLLLAVAAVAVAAVVLWSFVRAIIRSPGLIARTIETRRGGRGYRAVSQGLIAVGSGDIRAARKFKDEARRIAPNEPLTLLLSAQTAQLSGEGEAAAATFRQMAGRDDTKVLGLHGLFIEAQRRNDPAAALLYAEEAAKHATVPNWAGQAVLQFRCVAGDWSGALERLERNHKSGLVDKDTYRRQRAVLLTAQALALEDTDRDRAKALALEAVKLAPTFVPSATLAGRMLGEAGELRKAARIIEAAWVWNPHPDLADAYAHLRPGDSARERLARIEALAAKSPGDVEAALAVARAALDAQEFAIARAALSPLIASPTKRVAALMAELEEREHGDEGRAREWMTRALNARRDPAWTADGFVSERWLPVSPVTGRLDAFAWRDPLEGSDHVGAVIEVERRSAIEGPSSGAASSTSPQPKSDISDFGHRRVPNSGKREVGRGEVAAQSAAGEGDYRPTELSVTPPHPNPLPASGERERTEFGGRELTESVASSSQESPSQQEPRPRRPRSVTAVPLAPAVIPLVHAPDDPGPDPEAQVEPEPEPAVEPLPDSWSRIRQLFKS